MKAKLATLVTKAREAVVESPIAGIVRYGQHAKTPEQLEYFNAVMRNDTKVMEEIYRTGVIPKNLWQPKGFQEHNAYTLAVECGHKEAAIAAKLHGAKPTHWACYPISRTHSISAFNLALSHSDSSLLDMVYKDGSRPTSSILKANGLWINEDTLVYALEHYPELASMLSPEDLLLDKRFIKAACFLAGDEFIHTSNPGGNNIFMIAAMLGDAQTMAEACARGVDINQKNNRGQTALELLIKCGGESFRRKNNFYKGYALSQWMQQGYEPPLDITRLKKEDITQLCLWAIYSNQNITHLEEVLGATFPWKEVYIEAAQASAFDIEERLLLMDKCYIGLQRECSSEAVQITLKLAYRTCFKRYLFDNGKEGQEIVRKIIQHGYTPSCDFVPGYGVAQELKDFHQWLTNGEYGEILCMEIRHADGIKFAEAADRANRVIKPQVWRIDGERGMFPYAVDLLRESDASRKRVAIRFGESNIFSVNSDDICGAKINAGGGGTLCVLRHDPESTTRTITRYHNLPGSLLIQNGGATEELTLQNKQILYTGYPGHDNKVNIEDEATHHINVYVDSEGNDVAVETSSNRFYRIAAGQRVVRVEKPCADARIGVSVEIKICDQEGNILDCEHIKGTKKTGPMVELCYDGGESTQRCLIVENAERVRMDLPNGAQTWGGSQRKKERLYEAVPRTAPPSRASNLAALFIPPYSQHGNKSGLRAEQLSCVARYL